MNELGNRPALPAQCGSKAICHVGYDRDRVRGFGVPKFHHRGHGRLSGDQGGGVYSSFPPRDRIVVKIPATEARIRRTLERKNRLRAHVAGQLEGEASWAGQFGKLSFVLKGRFCAGWTNQAIEIIACWHINRAHQLSAASAGFSHYSGGVETSRCRAMSWQHPGSRSRAQQANPNPLGIKW